MDINREYCTIVGLYLLVVKHGLLQIRSFILMIILCKYPSTGNSPLPCYLKGRYNSLDVVFKSRNTYVLFFHRIMRSKQTSNDKEPKMMMKLGQPGSTPWELKPEEQGDTSTVGKTWRNALQPWLSWPQFSRFFKLGLNN